MFIVSIRSSFNGQLMIAVAQSLGSCSFCYSNFDAWMISVRLAFCGMLHCVCLLIDLLSQDSI